MDMQGSGNIIVCSGDGTNLDREPNYLFRAIESGSTHKPSILRSAPYLQNLSCNCVTVLPPWIQTIWDMFISSVQLRWKYLVGDSATEAQESLPRLSRFRLCILRRLLLFTLAHEGRLGFLWIGLPDLQIWRFVKLKPEGQIRISKSHILCNLFPKVDRDKSAPLLFLYSYSPCFSRYCLHLQNRLPPKTPLMFKALLQTWLLPTSSSTWAFCSGGCKVVTQICGCTSPGA